MQKQAAARLIRKVYHRLHRGALGVMELANLHIRAEIEALVVWLLQATKPRRLVLTEPPPGCLEWLFSQNFVWDVAGIKEIHIDLKFETNQKL